VFFCSLLPASVRYFFALGSKDNEDYNMTLQSKVGMARGLWFVIGRKKALLY